jgi:hypothetical protein
MRHVLAPRLICWLSLAAPLGACSSTSTDESSSEVTGSFTEGFEAGTKTAYAAANVTLGSGTWNMSDALIGTSSSDVKTGSKAARVRNSGQITMGADHTTGVGTVTIHHARYGSDPSGSWGLFASQDHGATFTQVGSTVSTNTTTFATASFAVNIAGDVRIEIRKLDGGSNRINIDDIAITDFGTSGSDAGIGDAGTNDAGTRSIQTVFVILMENHNWSSIKGNPSAPYINNTLLPMGAHAENYSNVPGIHPSEPNYLWLEAGTNFGVTNDNNPSSNHQSTTQHLVTQLQNAGISWRSYQEGISGTTCPLTMTGLYAPKHNPMVFFDDVTNTNSTSSPNCIQHVRPYTELASDLQNNTVARYNFITPNLCHDMHNPTGCATSDEVANGDTWLSTEVPKILASQAYQNGGALLITWDESEGGDFPIGMIVLSPGAKPGYANTIAYNHGSTLRTVQEIFGVTPLLGGAATSTDLSDLFVNFGGGGSGSLTCPGPGNPKANGGPCGTERWNIKVGTDPGASAIALDVVPNTIAALVALPANGGGASRTSPTETTIYELKDVVLTEVKLETNDSDYHLVLSDGTHTMIGEIPYPLTCGSASTWACFISRARSEVDAMFNVTATPQFPSTTVTVRGVGFFDTPHSQNGVAPNAIELHPILQLCFGTGCTPS